MTRNRTYNRCLICALILVFGLGLALVLPWLANSQGLAAQSEVSAQDNAPEATRYYVAKSGNGSDGKSWNKAFTNVQDALGAASSGDEIWVASGIYTPGLNREDSFYMVPGAALYGGFDSGDKKLSDRDWVKNVTVLSGDIGGDDTTDGNGVVTDPADINGDNAYHVVRADGTTGTHITGSTKLDGFTITAGNADGLSMHAVGAGFFCDGSGIGNECSPSLSNLAFSGSSADNGGGAMLNHGRQGTSSPSLFNVTFSGNSARYGGGMYNNGSFKGTSSPNLSGVTFSGNSADDYGGAMVNSGYDGGTSSPSLNNVTFLGNTAENGGGMYNDGYNLGTSNPSLKEVTFLDNSADVNGGAMYNNALTSGTSNPELINVDFSGNSALGNGGAMFNNGLTGESNPSLINVKFSGNKAGSSGGAMFNDGQSNGDSSPNLTNVTFSGNSAGLRAGAMYNFGGTGNSKPEVRNIIVWNNQDSSGKGTLKSAIRNDTAAITVTNSLVEDTGGSMYWTSDSDFVNGGGNIDEDPMFITPVDPSSAPTTAGNLRLQTNSPAINTGNNSFVTVSKDLAGNERISEGIVDMGAYETAVVILPLVYR